MAQELFDIKDDEIRVLRGTESNKDKPKDRRRKWPWIILALLLIAVVAIIWAIYRTGHSPINYSGEVIADTTKNITFKTSSETKAYTTFSNETINDIALQIYTPVGGHAELLVGQLPDNNPNIILAAQAADYRADNNQIAGAFIHNGKVIASGHPKYGFCAIIGDTITMGKSKETALFERAVDQEGHFFRQFSLVHDGKPGEKTPKGKAIRRALCYYKESIVIVETVGRESMHDFTQALMDMGVREAISLVGAIPLPLYVNEDGKRITKEIEYPAEVQENYIVWKK